MALRAAVCMRSLLFGFLLLVAWRSTWGQDAPKQGDQEKKRVTVVLVGATSSLAKKYLWQSFFKAFLEEEVRGPNVSYGIYGGATRPPAEGEGLLKSILESTTSCKGVKVVTPEVCEAKLQEFRGLVKYVMLREEANYADLGSTLQADLLESGLKEEGRLFYLSISPDFYGWVAAAIDQHARPQLPAWLRVVFEKPFGRDLASAEVLAAELGARLKEEEIYRVDHYMGKNVVQAILPFRHVNKEVLEELWNGRHVDSLEVVMKETEDCEGRTAFYEGYGVIRDVLQNHLTQMLVLLKMDLPPLPLSDVYGSHTHRTATLKTLRLHGQDADTEGSITVGQYEGYHEHVSADRHSRQRQPNDTPPGPADTKVPTAATVVLGSENPRWEGVKLYFKAGKALDDRSSYAKVIMRERQDPDGPPCQLIFNIQGGELGSAIAWDKVACEGVLPTLQAPPGWGVVEEDGHVIMRPTDPNPPNAYEVVVQEVLEGDQSMFLGTEELLHQWAVWDPVLAHADEQEPLVYPAGFDIDEIELFGFMDEEDEEMLFGFVDHEDEGYEEDDEGDEYFEGHEEDEEEWHEGHEHEEEEEFEGDEHDEYEHDEEEEEERELATAGGGRRRIADEL